MRTLMLICALVCLSISSSGSASVITSTPEGGWWNVGSTWIGGSSPGPGDEAIVDGPVFVSEQRTCAALTTTATGQLSNPSGWATLSVTTTVENHGLIDGDIVYFTMEIGGDLISNGIWTPHDTRFTGSGDHLITAAELSSHIELAPGATGDLLLEAPLHLIGDLTLNDGRLLMGPNSPLESEDGVLSGEFLCAGNELRILGWSYLAQCDLDAVVLVGDVSVGGQMNFTGGLTVTGTLRNQPIFGNGHVNIEGDLLNLGLIREDGYGFTISLDGDLINNGTIDNTYISIDGTDVHHLSMSPEASMSADLLLPEFEALTIVADTPLTLSGGVNLGPGTMILEPGSDLTFTGHGGLTTSLGQATLWANGNDIRLGEYGSISSATIDDVILRGPVELATDCGFTGGVIVADTLSNREFNADIHADVEGLLINQGLIRDFGSPFTVILRGDAENQGTWSNALVRVDGETDQFIGAGAGIAVPEFVLVSGVVAAGHQWFRDGQALPGETGAELILATVGTADYGSYHCEGSGGELSREIVIAEFTDLTAAPIPQPTARLGQNFPNPFNPSTEITFSLVEPGPVRLSIHDLAGRRVALLLDHALGAGDHRVRWQPVDLASGHYFYRLRAEGREITRKATLLK